MKRKAYSVNVPGKRGYSIFAATDKEADLSHEDIVDSLIELGAFESTEDAQCCNVEEMSEHEVSACPFKFYDLDGRDMLMKEDIL